MYSATEKKSCWCSQAVSCYTPTPMQSQGARLLTFIDAYLTWLNWSQKTKPSWKPQEISGNASLLPQPEKSSRIPPNNSQLLKSQWMHATPSAFMRSFLILFCLLIIKQEETSLHLMRWRKNKKLNSSWTIYPYYRKKMVKNTWRQL